jgi:hypothetical protein
MAKKLLNLRTVVTMVTENDLHQDSARQLK